jgi:hypothetical protein
MTLADEDGSFALLRRCIGSGGDGIGSRTVRALVWGINASDLRSYTYALLISGLTLSLSILTDLLRYSTQLGVLFSDDRIIRAKFCSFPIGGELIYAKSVPLSQKQIGEGFLGRAEVELTLLESYPCLLPTPTRFSPAKRREDYVTC